MLFQLVAELTIGALRLAVDGVEHVIVEAFKDSTKVDDAMHFSLRRDLFEILLLAAWHDGVLTEYERTTLESELARIDMSHLVDAINTAPSSQSDEQLQRRIRELTEGFSDSQRRYTLAAVERVLADCKKEGGFRDAASTNQAPTRTLFRSALSID